MNAIHTLLERPEFKTLRDTNLHELPFAELDPFTAERLRRASRKRRRGLTVARALRSLGSRDREILANWLRTLILEDPEGLRAGMSKPALQAWATARGLGWALTQPASAIGAWSGYTIGDIVSEDRRIQRRYDSRMLVDRAVTWLEGIATEADSLQHYVSGRDEVWRRSPAPPLQSLWTKLLAAYDALPTTAFTLWVDEALRLRDDPPAVRIPLDDGPVWISVEADRLDLPSAPHRRAACCIVLLDLLQSHAEWLVRELGRPAWERHLVHLDQLLEVPPIDEDEDKRLLGWELEEADGLVSSINALPVRYTGGGRIPGRRVAIDELPSALIDSTVDRDIVSRLAIWKRPPPEIAIGAIARLAGHPRVVFMEGGRRDAVEVRVGDLELHVARHGQTLVTRFQVGERIVPGPRLLEVLRAAQHIGGTLVAFRHSGDVLVVRCTRDQRRFALGWLQRDAVLPLSALQGLLGRLPALQRVCSVQLDPDVRGRPLEGDPRPLWRLSYRNDGLVLEARIHPVADAPSFPPGEGPDTLHVVRGGAPACVVRSRRE
ncbi:MAG: hypothetical protein AAF602_09965, partial [Myxococcota bacterium]